MFLKILKKDIKRKKVMNAILFSFIVIASMLVASSANLLYTTNNAVDDYLEMSNVQDYYALLSDSEEENKNLENWLSDNELINATNIDKGLRISKSNVLLNDKELGDEVTSIDNSILSMVPEKYNIVYNQSNNEFTLKEGEIAVPQLFSEEIDVNIGDKIVIKFGNTSKEFTVKEIAKDPVFGSGLMGIKRMFISDADFTDIVSNNPDEAYTMLCYFTAKDNVSQEDIQKSYAASNTSPYFEFSGDTIKFSYIMDLISAAAMVVVSIFLILIAFLLLNFTIGFTVQEDFKEIGIMKAIGLKNINIKLMYLVKYLFIAVTGAIVGFVLSFQFEKIIGTTITNHIVLKSGRNNFVLALISVIVIVVITMLFCYGCTNKISKLSAIDSIRNGSNGERYSKSSKLSLHKSNKFNISSFLAINDILSNVKKFIILAVTFVFGTAIIIIPIDVLNTFRDKDFITSFGFTKIDCIVSQNYISNNLLGKDREESDKIVNDIEEEIKSYGYDVDLFQELFITVQIYNEDKNEAMNIYSVFSPDNDKDDYELTSGSMAQDENELMLSGKAAKYYNVEVGDTIHCVANGEDKEYIVSATYESMNNTGFSLRFSKKFDCDFSKVEMRYIFGEFSGLSDKEINSAINTINSKNSEYNFTNTQDFIESMVGNIYKQFNLIKAVIIGIVLLINVLITCLIVKMMLSKESSEIAIMKAIGITERNIEAWQIKRIGLLLIISIILGIVFAIVSGNILSKFIFGMMGVNNLKLTILPLQVYVMYPLLIFIVAIVTVWISVKGIKKIKETELNNQE